MTYARLRAAAEADGLIVMGALDVAATGAKALTGGSLILLGAGDAFWPAFTAAPMAWRCRALPQPADRMKWLAETTPDMAARPRRGENCFRNQRKP